MLFLELSGLMSEPAVDPVQELVSSNQNHQRDDKNHPAFGFVKEAFGQRRIYFAEDSGQSHASRVGDNRDGDSGNQQDPSHPDLPVEEIRVDQREKRER